MAVSSDTFLERFILKRRIARWRLTAIIAFTLFLIALVGTTIGSTPMSYSYIARVDISGVIDDDPDRMEDLEELRNNDRVKAVIIRVNSPGGTIVGGESLRKSLQRIGEKKPVVALMRNIATSGGYMASLGATRIYAERGTLTGSIGVVFQSFEATALADKIGIKPIVVKSSPLKAVPNPAEVFTEAGRDSINRVVQGYQQVFIDMVAESRNLPRKDVIPLADGRVFTGSEAVELKLVDAIGGEREARDWLAAEHNISSSLHIIQTDKEDAFLQSLQGKVMNSLQGLNPAYFYGMMAMWHPQNLQ